MDALAPLLAVCLLAQRYVDEIAYLPPHPVCYANWTFAKSYADDLGRWKQIAPGEARDRLEAAHSEAMEHANAWWWFMAATSPGLPPMGFVGMESRFENAAEIRRLIGEDRWHRKDWPPITPYWHFEIQR